MAVLMRSLWLALVGRSSIAKRNRPSKRQRAQSGPVSHRAISRWTALNSQGGEPQAASKAEIRKQARHTLLPATQFPNCCFKAHWAKAGASKLSNRDFPAAKWFTSATQEHRHVGHVWACGTCSDPQAHLGCWLFAADSAGDDRFAQRVSTVIGRVDLHRIKNKERFRYWNVRCSIDDAWAYDQEDLVL